MSKIIAALAVAGAIAFGGGFVSVTTADARTDGVSNGSAKQAAVTEELSAHKRKYRHRHRKSVRVYTYPETRPYPYGYYGPVYYDRPYRRPSGIFLGIGSRW